MALSLSLVDELVLLLLNEENGYFHQVPGWDLNCAVLGGPGGTLLPVKDRHRPGIPVRRQRF